MVGAFANQNGVVLRLTCVSSESMFVLAIGVDTDDVLSLDNSDLHCLEVILYILVKTLVIPLSDGVLAVEIFETLNFRLPSFWLESSRALTLHRTDARLVIRRGTHWGFSFSLEVGCAAKDTLVLSINLENALFHEFKILIIESINKFYILLLILIRGVLGFWGLAMF